MPRRKDIKKIMVIGSGPIVIGQAAEFDYAGTQACLALKEEGYEIIAFALSEDSIALNEYQKNEKKKAVILGNEDHGISRDTLAACDCTIMIPMQRGVDSLNVAAASAVAFWEIFR